MIDLITLGSQTAKQGFQNEYDVIDIFNNWKQNKIAQQWLEIMGYDLDDIEYVKAIKVSPGHKTDVQVQVKIIIKLKEEIDVQNISVKLVSNNTGFNQIDKRWIKKYQELWNIPENVATVLRYFCGELCPYKSDTGDTRRMFLNEMNQQEQLLLLNFFNQNKIMIVSDILKGRGEFCAEWMLVVKKTSLYEWVLKPINEVMNFFGNGEIKLSPRGSLLIGKITMQRKGGDGGRNTANMLQFKIDPIELFDMNSTA